MLAIGGKVIRRDASNNGWFTPGVKFEQVSIGPDVRAVMCDENGNITE